MCLGTSCISKEMPVHLVIFQEIHMLQPFRAPGGIYKHLKNKIHLFFGGGK